MDLPTDLPEFDVPPMVMTYCAQVAGTHYKINPLVISSIADIEGGKIGSVSENTNGTYDLGIMQLNTTNFETIKKRFPEVTISDLVTKPCINIYVATWFLSEEIRMAKGNIWKAVGNYHSRTPKYHNRYLERFKNAYAKRVRKQIKAMRKNS